MIYCSGGELELIKHAKDDAVKLIMDGTYKEDDLLKVSYEQTGCAILVQGTFY
jgi:hypothetical protein